MKLSTEIWTDESDVVMYVNGVKCKIEIEPQHNSQTGIIDRVNIKINKTEEDLTKEGRSGYYYKWGGWPIFRQQSVIPASDDNKPYTYICTINNDWGDMGNVNVFVLIDENFCVKDIFIETSCC